MAQQTINLGTTPNDGTGDTLRSGGDKINDNFDELYAEDAALDGRVTTLEGAIGGGGDLIFIGRTAVSASSAVDIALPAIYDSFHIEFYFTASADQIGLNGAITDDNFATVESGATDYYYTRLAHTGTSTGVVTSNGTTAISILGTSSIGNASNEYCDGSIQVFNAKETAPTHIRIDISWVTGTTTYGSTRCMAAYKQTGSVNGLRITPTSGTLTGFYKVWGRTA